MNRQDIDNKTRRRMTVVLFLFLTFTFTFILGRLFIVQILRHESYQTRAIEQQVRDTTITPRRGTIYDRNMKTLAVSASTETVYIAPKSMKDESERVLVATELSRILGVEYETVLKKSRNENYYEIIKRQVEKEQADLVRAFVKEHQLSSVALAEDSKRYYPYGAFASHVLGFTNVDGEGIEGIEAYYNDLLIGKPGRIITAKNAHGTDMPFQYEQYIDAQNGYSLVLTIDEAVQHFIEKGLENAVVEFNVQNRATAIVMDVNTGAILGMATKPDFDLNNPREITDPELLAELEALSGSEYSDRQMEIWQSMWRNKAIADSYEPGSVFKILTAAMALEKNVVTTHESFHCPGFKVVAGVRIGCWKHGGHGTQNMLEGLKNSCNPVFMELGSRVGGADFYDFAEAFGLLERTGIDLYGEATGIFFDKNTIAGGPVETAVAAFGQTFKVTPIQMITAVSACVNGGYLYQPYLVSKVVDDNGNVLESYDPVARRQVLSEQTAATVATMLEQVVSTGTGKNAYIKGYRIGGKTGTSEKIDEKNEEGVADKRISSFCAIAPADDPQIALLLLMDEPETDVVTGGLTAAPTVRKMLEDILPYLGIMPQYTEEELASLEHTVPDVTGLPIPDAREQLKGEDFVPTVIGDGETVLEQVPRSGQKLSRGGKVLLYTESGATGSLKEVPDVTGLSLSAARSKLEKAGFNLSTAGVDLGSQEAHAVAQSPIAGSLAEEGSVVEVEFVHEVSSEWVNVSY
ncbi:MAG: PASTA domain-containing protein [Clostridia bacterium]|nr:PASTA domain-containing protein [Clostridia bacterium]